MPGMLSFLVSWITEYYKANGDKYSHSFSLSLYSVLFRGSQTLP